MPFTDFVCLFGKEGRGRTSARRRQTGGPTREHKNGCGPVHTHRPTAAFVFVRGSEPFLSEKTHEVGECHASYRVSFTDFVWKVGERPWTSCVISRLCVTNARCLAEEAKKTAG